jgi:hypothetical protein
MGSKENGRKEQKLLTTSQNSPIKPISETENAIITWRSVRGFEILFNYENSERTINLSYCPVIIIQYS